MIAIIQHFNRKLRYAIAEATIHTIIDSHSSLKLVTCRHWSDNGLHWAGNGYHGPLVVPYIVVNKLNFTGIQLNIQNPVQVNLCFILHKMGVVQSDAH